MLDPEIFGSALCNVVGIGLRISDSTSSAVPEAVAASSTARWR
jgi:hypothetical protein